MISSPLLKNNGFGEGLFAMNFWKVHANLTSPSACHRIYPFYRATFPFFFYFYFSSSFSYSFFFPFFFFLFPFSFFFLFFYFFILLFIFSPSFPLLFLVALLEGARKGIISSYQHFYRYNYKNYFPIFKNF
jgi:hypothetical protein